MKTYKNFLLEKNIPTKMSIPKDIEQIAKLFHDAGKDLFVVGGAVRDFLQGKTPHDYDIVTNALPEESKRILHYQCMYNKGWNISDEQGKNFGVLRIYTPDEPLGYELATYRKDISKGRDVKGEEQKVEIGSHITINDDVKRRDLTINALFYDINKKEVVDLVGGIEDIKKGVIRAVGDPKERFNEDRLRILRVFRFAARTGGKIDPGTSEAIKTDNRLRGIGPKDDVSQERIHEEWNKMLEHAQKANSTQMMEDYLSLLSDYDMWKQMFPGMRIDTTGEIDYLDNALIFYGLFNKDDIRGKRKMLVQNLKFPINLVNKLDFIESYKIAIQNGYDDVYKLAKLKERYHIDDELILKFVDEYGLSEKFAKSFIKYCNDGFVVDGNELMELGFKGKTIEEEKERREISRFKNEYIYSMKRYNNFINEGKKYWVFEPIILGEMPITKMPCDMYNKDEAIKFLMNEYGERFNKLKEPYMEEETSSKIEPVKHSDFVYWLHEHGYYDATDMNLKDMFSADELEYLHNKYREIKTYESFRRGKETPIKPYSIIVEYGHGDADFETKETYSFSTEEEMRDVLKFLIKVRNFIPNSGWGNLGYYEPLTGNDGNDGPEKFNDFRKYQEYISTDKYYHGGYASINGIQLRINNKPYLLLDSAAANTNLISLPNIGDILTLSPDKNIDGYGKTAYGKENKYLPNSGKKDYIVESFPAKVIDCVIGEDDWMEDGMGYLQYILLLETDQKVLKSGEEIYLATTSIWGWDKDFGKKYGKDEFDDLEMYVL